MSDVVETASVGASRTIQLRLLPPARPLDERLGAAFFRGVPREPGVYLMRDDQGRLLYVGKARNLRQRLNSYRHLGHASRKTVRLVHRVAGIAWEVCPSEPAALLRENELLRTHRPRFNRANTWPHSYAFIKMVIAPHRLMVRLVRESLPKANGTGLERLLPMAPEPLSVDAASLTFGAFKAGTTRAHAALLRLLWLVSGTNRQVAALPRQLLQERPPREFAFPMEEATEWPERLRAYLAGDSLDLINALDRPEAISESPFGQHLLAADHETLSHFFETGPRHRREACERLGRTCRLVAATEVDDLPFLVRLRQEDGADQTGSDAGQGTVPASIA